MKQYFKIKLALIILFTTSIITAQNSNMNVKYPETKKINHVDNYFGTEVQDPYRWLEDDRSAETEAWVKAENKVTFNYLDKIPFRDDFKKRLTQLWNYEKVGSPFKRGDYYYFYKNDGLQNQYVLYRQKNNEEAEIFLNPNTFSKDGTTSLGSVSFSKNGKKVAYAISEGGSDWRKVIVMDALSKEILEDTIKDVKFSGLSWYKNEGFYYSSYDKPKGSELSAKTDQHKLYYHKLGSQQKEDKIIFGLDKKRRYVGGYVTEDQKYLVISAATSTSGNELYFKDLSNSKNRLITIVDNFESDSHVVDSDGDDLFISTNLNAPNKKIIKVNAKNPAPSNWIDFIPETENV
ncbi:MAG: S9 family peptidase, partial [Flavobacteriaceae bacterium]|nr:S9 family peptidase [Flavobacteriaceae bacterium]